MLLVKCSQRGSLVPRKLSPPPFLSFSFSRSVFARAFNRTNYTSVESLPLPRIPSRTNALHAPRLARSKRKSDRERERERSKERKIRTCGIICYVAKWGWTPVGRARFYLNSLNSRLSFASRSNTRSETFIVRVNPRFPPRKKKKRRKNNE